MRKSAYPESEGRKESLRDIEQEFQIYQRLPKHNRLLQVISYCREDGLVLEYMSHGNLRQYLQDAVPKVTVSQRMQWACDAAEALQILHAHRIIHCDINPENFLLDSTLRLRIIDFSGSSLDGKWASAFESVRFCLPRPWEEQSTIVTDLFALGSTIYEIMTGQPPYEDLPEQEVENKYMHKIFPDVETIPCGEVIKGCWHSQIKSADETMKLIKDEIEMVQEGICS